MQTEFIMTHKIHFENKELDAMHETELFRIKYLVSDKVAHLFGTVSEQLKEAIAQYDLPGELASKRARIFRGENYLQLPYVVMDYPALFAKEVSFAYRTMFWWGNFFSFTLQMSGQYLEQYHQNLLSNMHKLKGMGFYFCINSTPWEYHYNIDNYRPVEDILQGGTDIQEKQINQHHFVKLSQHIGIAKWSHVSNQCTESFHVLMEITGMEKR
jgi:hypothetical protein